MKFYRHVVILFCLIAHFHSFAQIGGDWKLAGPGLFPQNVSGQINGIGRVCQIKFDPVNPITMYAASASGGLWISHDHGVTWSEAGTDFLPYSQCASVCIDYTNTNVIYLGTGDPNYYGQAVGVWKSTDGGNSWSPANNSIGNRMAVELLMDPTDHNVLIAATNDGIWKTYDGGATWSEKFTGGAFTDMQFQPLAGSNIIYAVTWSGYFRSNDMGETWSPITNGVFIPGGDAQGMRLAVSPANANVVYLGMIAGEGTILKSEDAGLSFTTVKYDPSQSLVGYSADESGQGNYNFSMTADPDDVNIVYVVAHVVWKSTDGGITWTQLTDWWADCHTDMHDVEVSPVDHTKLFDANDGGVFLSMDGGDNWEASSDGLAATECYHAATSQLREDVVSIGTQDNGELYYSDGKWKTNRGGDWGPTEAFDYQSDDYVYYIGSGNRRHLFGGGDDNLDFPFTADNSVRMAFNAANNNIAFLGKKDLYRTTGLNEDPPTWVNIHPSISTVKAICSSPADPNVLYVVYNNLSVLRSENALDPTPTFTSLPAPSPTGNGACITVLKNYPDVLYLACGGRMFRSPDKGVSWTDITYNLPLINIYSIYSDDFSTDESMYIGTAKGVYFKNDTMTSWLNYSQGLPTIADITDFMMFNDGTSCGRLRVSYYGRGVWEASLNKPQTPQSRFTVDRTEICPGSTVQYSDNSCGEPTTWNWSFPGGTPSVSFDQNPVITYQTAGTYNATLIASNANGTSTTTQEELIHVVGTVALPLAEGFEGAFLPSFWTMYDDNNDQVTWKQSGSAGGYGNSSKSAIFDNYDYDAGGLSDEMRSPKYNFTNIAAATLTFDHAYCSYDATYYDSLAVLVSTDCGVTFSEVWLKGYSDLATAPYHTNYFVPEDNEWVSDTIDLSAFVEQANVMIIFQNRGHYGNVLYVDNVNLDVSTQSAPIAAFTADKLTACAGSSFHFTDQSIGLSTSWNWNFSGGTPTSSSSQNPDITYNSPGTFDVSLTASNSFGNNTITYTGYITILAPPATPTITASGFELTSSNAFEYQWYLNGNLISGATSQVFIAPQSGDYTVIVTDENGCSAESDPYHIFAVGISESFAGGTVNVFPNPGTGVFHVVVDLPKGREYSIDIYNSIGQQVFTENLDSSAGNIQKSIDLTNTGKGIYFFRITSGEENIVRKLIVN